MNCAYCGECGPVGNLVFNQEGASQTSVNVGVVELRAQADVLYVFYARI